MNLFDVFSHEINFEDSKFKKAEFIKEGLEMILTQRKIEIDAANSFIKLMSRFYKYFEQFDIEYHKFHEDLRNFKQNEFSELNNILEPVTLNEMYLIDWKNTNRESYLIDRIKGFEDIDRNKLDFLKSFLELASDSPILNYIVKEAVRLENENKPRMNLKMFSEKLNWCHEKFNQLGNEIQSGNIKINEFEKLTKVDPKSFKLTYQKNAQWKNTLSSMMKGFPMNDKQIEKRLNQYEIFCKLNNIKDIANLILEIREKNALGGDFSKLENMLRLVYKMIIFIYSSYIKIYQFEK